jgi:rubrerythrin
MIDEVRIIGHGGHAFKLAQPLEIGGHIHATHRTHKGCIRHGVTVLAALPTRWTCASCGTSFAGPLCPNCNGAAA